MVRGSFSEIVSCTGMALWSNTCLPCVMPGFDSGLSAIFILCFHWDISPINNATDGSTAFFVTWTPSLCHVKISKVWVDRSCESPGVHTSTPRAAVCRFLLHVTCGKDFFTEVVGKSRIHLRIVFVIFTSSYANFLLYRAKEISANT